MVSREQIETFLDRLTTDSGSYQEVEEGLWVVKPGGKLAIDVVVHYSPPVLLIRVNVMDLPDDPAQCAPLYPRLLQLNATDLVHGSYGITEEAVILTEALELSHLDYQEFLAAYESMTLALASHLREFASFREVR